MSTKEKGKQTSGSMRNGCAKTQGLVTRTLKLMFGFVLGVCRAGFKDLRIQVSLMRTWQSETDWQKQLLSF